MTTTEQLYLHLNIDFGLEKEKVDRLRRKLGEKAKQEKNFKFYSLYGHIWNMDVLKMAWKEVRANKGSPGVDGMSIETLDTKEKVMEFLKEIQTMLKEKTYRPKPVRRVFIPKADGKLRPLGIPTVRDRVIQAATRLILEPIFEADFLDCSYGFRPERSQHQALNTIRTALKTGMNSVYDADLKGYFDSIPHEKLMSCIQMRIVDRNVLHLIRMWLKAPVQEDKGGGKGPKIEYPKQGTPQGGVISPLLANIYLHWFDFKFQRTEEAKKGIAQLVRYADDFVILAYDISESISEFVRKEIEEWLGLVINKEKTKTVNLKEGDELLFLGYTFRYYNDLHGRRKKYLHMGPSEKSIKKGMEKIREMTERRNNHLPITELIKEVNESLKGWAAYFSKGYPRMAYRKINWYVRERLTNHLKRRSQRRCKPPKGVSYYKQLKELGLIYL